ncbi:hypothetical protein [Nodularia sp. NIES-3585]|uniref:hypothetical protein n=1 Tax=Nodularia sp. NIES-3585 TaxID=1973477 RepID=UPI000B5C3A75|nr:hypothetical protein [Nodularia sp. NIES-3585]GAX38577.1 hypothetical protein NIES3585_46260 [Nodularia sp. NIES-3585]
MPHRHYPPAYLRYLRARLRNLAKPSFWVTAIFLSVLGLVILEYWSKPNMFTYNQEEEVTSLESDDSSLSAEERAVVADIDNLPTLFRDLEQGNLPITANIPAQTSMGNNNDNSLKEVNKQKASNSLVSSPGISTFNNTSSSAMKNPFIAEAENLLQSGAFNIGNQSLGVNSLAASPQSTRTAATSFLPGIAVNQTGNSQNTDSMSFSQPSLNQSTNQNLPVLNGETANQINSLGQTSSGGVMQIPPNNGLPSQNLSPSTGLNIGTGIQPTVAVPNNQPLNSFNNINNIQGLPSPIQPPTPISPVTYGVQTNTAPSSMQPPTPNNVTPMTPVVADQNGNLMWRSPSQQMESNSLDSRQIPAQDTGRVQNNNFDFSNFQF